MNPRFQQFLKDHQIQAFIFDMDGTLLDSMKEWHTISKNFLLEQGRQPAPDIDQQLKAMEGKDIVRYLIDTYQLDCTPKELIDYVTKHVSLEYEHRVPCKPFVMEFLTQLRQAGIPFCICTMSQWAIAQAALLRLGIWNQLEFVLTPKDVGGVRKELPDIYNEAARRFGLEPARCLVFEDTLLCIQTARGAGFPTVGVYDPASASFQPAIQQLSSLYIRSFEELL